MTELIKGNRYNFIDQKERLIYAGKYAGWHQFVQVGKPQEVWAELTDSDLHLIEVTNG